MTMARVAIVVASPADVPARAEILKRLAEEAVGLAEVWLVGAIPEGLAGSFHALPRPSTLLVPELWRDGMEASTSLLVAFTTTSMMPARGWLVSLVQALERGASGAGGPIVAGENLGTVDTAIYLHRFVRYAPPVVAIDPPGDNAIYRRAAICAFSPLWVEGFWEARIHPAIREAGGTLAHADGAVAAFLGGGRFGPFLGRRLAHARIFGGERDGLRRFIGLILAPAVAVRLSIRALRAAGGCRLRRLAAAPALALICATWALGEALGRPRPRRPAQGVRLALGHRPPA